VGEQATGFAVGPSVGRGVGRWIGRGVAGPVGVGVGAASGVGADAVATPNVANPVDASAKGEVGDAAAIAGKLGPTPDSGGFPGAPAMSRAARAMMTTPATSRLDGDRNRNPQVTLKYSRRPPL